MKSAAERFRLLGDEIRLRILSLLEKERLNVTELTSILGIAQSGVSRHLRLLKEGGLLRETRTAGFTWFQAEEIPELTAGKRTSIHKEDHARLKELLRKREEEFPPESRDEYELVPGRSWAAWARALGHLLPPLRVVDLASGEGFLTIEIARWAKEVVAIDRSSQAIRRGKKLAERAGIENVLFKKGEIEKIPLSDRSADVAVFSQSLRHAEAPARALEEAHRILIPGGTVLLLELKKHKQEWVQKKLGDRWMGFDEKELLSLLKNAGFTAPKTQSGTQRRGDPFKVVVASAKRPPRSKK